MAGPGDATWTEIPDDNLSPGQPGRSIDALALRDNARAVAEGSDNAPRVMTGIFNNRVVYAASDTFVVPDEVYCVNVWIVGGGGAGGSNAGTASSGGSSSFDGISVGGGVGGGTTTESNGGAGGNVSLTSGEFDYVARAARGQRGGAGETATDPGNGQGGESGLTVGSDYSGITGGVNAGVDFVDGRKGGGGQGRQVVGVYGGGGGGGFVELRAYPVTPGASVTVVVGSGGSAATNSGRGGDGYVILEY